MRARLVAGNWKMYGSLAANQRLLEDLRSGLVGLSGASCAVCVPFPYLAQAASSLTGSAIAWGAQTLSEHAAGAYTGEVSGAMLRDFGCTYVIVGHSERRALCGERDAQVAAKFAAAQAVGLTPILCVGETLEEREQGATEEVVTRQLKSVMERAGVSGLGGGVLAYEPIWAIGTDRTATPQQAQSVHELLRAEVAKRDPKIAAQIAIIYGGSVKPENAAALFAMPDIDGALVGGASLVAADFVAIVRSAAEGRQE